MYATPAAQVWLTELYNCASNSATVLNLTADQPDIYLRVGEPEAVISPVFQIDEEEILIATNRVSPVQNLTLEDAQSLFALGDPSIQVWVYSAGDDVQDLFDELVMKGRSVTSFAKVAVSPQNMSDLLNANPNAVGILPKHWKVGDLRQVYSAGTVPVLAMTKVEPQGAVRDLISCLQSN